jgi:DNA-binding helix-hairpin-helix protein with protein kinase domain
VTKLYDAAGQPLELGDLLGRGGEGAVHALIGRPGFAAKVYHRPIGTHQALKLASMARQAHPALLDFAAWPVAVLRVRPAGPVQGFIMPKVDGYREIHSLYGPAHRRKTFPQADWSFLVHAARNLASAFAALHARGHVIGDVNPGNVVVSAQALIKLIDCDSFQIQVDARTAAADPLFPCDVGVPQFTAPELQGRPFHGLRRTPDHDAFGLALLCFHLLFMGRHPFAGRYQGHDDMPIERAIREYRFAFGRHAATRQMEPPPHTLPFTALPASVADLFERAFAPPGLTQGRPTARDWFHALERLGTELRICDQTRVHHQYPRPLKDCPWCALERVGAVFFPAPERFPPGETGADLPAFDLDRVWNRILAITLPDENPPPPSPPSKAAIGPTPLPAALRRVRRRNRIAAAVIAGAASLATGMHWPLGWLWWLLAAVAWSLLRDPAARREGQRRRLALLAVRREGMELRAAGRPEAIQQPFTAKRQALQTQYDRYRELAAELQQALQHLETDQRQIQLHGFLDRQFIDAAQIPGIYTTDQMALASYGIETAADVSPEALRGVPGFGRRLGRQRTAALLAWRQDLERRFRFDPRQGVDPAAVARLRHRYAQERTRIERELLAGPDELAKIKGAILQHRNQIETVLIHQALREAQAEADWRAFRPSLDRLRRWCRRLLAGG